MSTGEDKIKVVILTGHYRIKGEIALATGARLTDFIVEAKAFIAVTDAEITGHDGNLILTSSFTNIHRERIEAIMPAELAIMA